MNITYLIGNGFDSGLGLKMAYKFFYPYFLKNANDNNQLKSEIEEDSKKDYKNWSDLEVQLGKYTSKVSTDANGIEKFLDDKIELDELLKVYLKEEEKKFKVDDNCIKETMISAFKHFREGNNETEKEKIENTLRSKLSENYFYKCITFNYTSTVDQMWDSVKSTEIGRHSHPSGVKKESVGDVLHIHGTLINNEMLIGVNDESQIDNLELAKDRNIRWALIKPYLNSELGHNKIQKAKRIIDDSSVICVYGMSIGITDNMWWEHIGNWLIRNSNNILIIYNYDAEYVVGHPVKQLVHKQTVRNNFLNNTKLNSEQKKSLESQIIVYDNENIFGMV